MLRVVVAMETDPNYRFPKDSANRFRKCLWCGKWMRPRTWGEYGEFTDYCSLKCRSAAMPEYSLSLVCASFICYLVLYSSFVSAMMLLDPTPLLPQVAILLVVFMTPSLYLYYIGRKERQAKGISGLSAGRDGDWSQSGYD
jgi:hypothetical protein